MRGVVVIDSIYGKARTRAWPAKRPGERHPTNVFWTNWLVGITYMYRYLPARMQVYMNEVTKGTPWMPRDIHISTARGRAWSFSTDGGRVYYPLVAKQAVSQSLDTIGQLVGQMLWRGANLWEPIAPPTLPGQLLGIRTVGAAPEWLGGGGGDPSGPETISWSALAKPTSPGALDDEFADASGGVPAGWTTWDHAGRLTVTEDQAGLKLSLTSAAPFAWAGIYQTLPAGDFDVWTKVQQNSVGANAHAGILLLQDPTNAAGDLATVTLQRSGTPGIQYQRYTDYDTFGANITNFASLRTSAFLRITRTGSNFVMYFSDDGVTWWRQGTPGTLPFTVSHIGLAIAQDATGQVASARFPFFRYLDADQGLSPLLGGNNVTLFRAL